jgi:glutamate-1-semialdehyde aminotransferase
MSWPAAAARADPDETGRWPGPARPPRAAGVPKSTAAATLTATYNDLQSVKDLFAANKGEIAGLILEPVVGNSGFIVPTKEFLQVSQTDAL